MSSSLFRASDAQIESLERLHDQAQAQIVRNDFEGAIRTYSEILLLEPDDETAYEGLGNCYLLLGRYRKATEAYHNALSINPQNETAILGLQKIMDPDGVEGMIHPLQVDSEAFENALEAGSAAAPAVVAKQPQIQRPARVAPAAPKRAVRKPLSLPLQPAGVAMARQKTTVLPQPAAPRKLKAEKPQTVLGFAKAARHEKPAPLRSLALLAPLNKFERLERFDAETAKPLPALPAAVVRPREATLPAPIVFDSPAPKTSRAPKAAPLKTGNVSKKSSVTPVPIVRDKASPKKTAASEARDAVEPREIQKALRNTGFYSGPIDGILGPGSRKAVKEYQLLHELTPDGVVGPRTWASLRLYLDPNEA